MSKKYEDCIGWNAIYDEPTTNMCEYCGRYDCEQYPYKKGDVIHEYEK